MIDLVAHPDELHNVLVTPIKIFRVFLKSLRPYVRHQSLQASRRCSLQVCGGYADAMGRCGQLLDEHLNVDFVDINMGCPIDLICNK